MRFGTQADDVRPQLPTLHLDVQNPQISHPHRSCHDDMTARSITATAQAIWSALAIKPSMINLNRLENMAMWLINWRWECRRAHVWPVMSLSNVFHALQQN